MELERSPSPTKGIDFAIIERTLESQTFTRLILEAMPTVFATHLGHRDNLAASLDVFVVGLRNTPLCDVLHLYASVVVGHAVARKAIKPVAIMSFTVRLFHNL